MRHLIEIRTKRGVLDLVRKRMEFLVWYPIFDKTRSDAQLLAVDVTNQLHNEVTTNVLNKEKSNVLSTR